LQERQDRPGSKQQDKNRASVEPPLATIRPLQHAPALSHPTLTVRIDILSLFPAISDVMLGESMMKRAQEAGLVTIKSHNIRDWATDKHRTTDDMPYGGGQGMVLKAEPIFAAVEQLRTPDARVVFMSPSGRPFTQQIAQTYAAESHLIVLCGHYEGVDQRVLDHLVTDEISIGDYILTNGAIAAVVFVDAIVRLIPGVLGHNESATDESFVTGQLEGPHYTRPADFRGWKVPDVLLSGNHAKIAAWRREQGRLKTERVRPDLLSGEA
jgi:tRNA (guanine37-N1)-methyltransferase